MAGISGHASDCLAAAEGRASGTLVFELRGGETEEGEKGNDGVDGEVHRRIFIDCC